MSNRSPSIGDRRRSFQGQIAALSARLTRALSTDRSSDSASIDSSRSTVVDENEDNLKARSISRGRDVLTSTGRGGAGNIRRSSASRDARAPEEEINQIRGRHPVVNADKIHSTGRGGAGNIHSPSRDPQAAAQSEAAELAYEREVIERNRLAKAENHHFSTGRGGAGNISNSRSRSRNPERRSPSRGRSPPMHLHITGRGGAGNIEHGINGENDLQLDDHERFELLKKHPEVIHSTGRGGAGNVTGLHTPDIEHVQHESHGVESTGRGGAGNIIGPGARSPSREASERRTPSRLTAFMNKVVPHHHQQQYPYPHEQQQQHENDKPSSLYSSGPATPTIPE